MSMKHYRHDDNNCSRDDDEPIDLWNEEGQISADVGITDYFYTNSSFHHMRMMLSLAEVDTESDGFDDTFTMMSDHDNEDVTDTHRSCRPSENYQLLPCLYKKSFPSFYGDDDQDDDDDKSFDDCSESTGGESGDEAADEISTSHVSIRTPPQDNLQARMFPNGNNLDHFLQVTPEPPANVSLPMTFMPQMSDVQMQVQRTLRKLACSMRRSDATRTLLKRQRCQYQYVCETPTKATKKGMERSMDFEDDDTTFDVLTPEKLSHSVQDKYAEIDLERRKVYRIIQSGLRSESSISEKIVQQV